MKVRYLHIIVLFLFFGQRLYAQRVEVINIAPEKVVNGSNLRFDRLNVENDNYKKATSKGVILHDKKGYLWIQSELENQEELVRYDGNYSKSFKGKFWSLFQTPAGVIYGTNQDGLILYDATTETFRKYTNPFLKTQAIDVRKAEKNGQLWFTQLDEKYAIDKLMPFFRFDSNNGQIKRFLPKYIINGYSGKRELFHYKNFNPSVVDADGLIWGTFDIRENFPSSMLGYFDPKTLKCVGFPCTSVITPELVGAKYENAFTFMNVAVVDSNYVWLGHRWQHAGLIRFDKQTHHWKQFLFPSYFANLVSNIARKNHEELWLKNENGLVVFNENTQLSTIYNQSKTTEGFSLSANAIGFVEGQKNSLWFGLENAVNNSSICFLDTKKQFFNQNQYLPQKSDFFRILHKTNTKLFYSYGFENKIRIIEYNYKTKTARELWNYDFGKIIDQVIAPLNCLSDTVNHKLWLSFGNKMTGSAIMLLDDKQGRVIPIKATVKGLPEGQNKIEQIKGIVSVSQDKAGDVWFGNLGTLIKFDHLTQQFEGFQLAKYGFRDIEHINSIMADVTGKIWIGNRNRQLHWFDPMTKKLQRQIKIQKGMESDYGGDTDIRKMIEDTARKVVWIAKNDAGLIKYNSSNNTYSKISGIGSVYNMYLTKDGMMWIRTPYCLIRYNPDTEQVLKFGPEYGFTNFDWTPFTKTQDDEFFFGKFRFRHQDILIDNTKPKAIFSFVKIFDETLTLRENLNDAHNLELKYNQNFFSVGFSILSYFDKDQNKYKYQLEGFNKDWVNVGKRPLATSTNVPPGQYILKIKGADNNGIWSDERILKIVVIPAYWQTWWFKVFCFLVLAGIIYTIYRYQLREKLLKSKLKAEEALRKQTEAELKQKISQTEITALRAQMNPHFIFNCLNSIQLFTAQNEADKASEYLSKFSRLIRLVLENSRSEKVTLENELETLRLYIEMEAMRFKGKVSYHINIAEGIDASYIQIPPLLVQPFVENAIWHGLMHKEEGGMVNVEVTQPNENLLHIEISDDGIGREKAAEFKSKSATINKSFGMKVTNERIEQIGRAHV